MPDIVLVQASNVLADADVIAGLPALGKWAKLVTDAYGLERCDFSFMSLTDVIAGKASGAWPLFLNRHSTDASMLGFHDTQDGAPYGRSFSGDDLLDGLNPWVTLTHEAGEMIGNPFVKNFVTLRDGSICPRELSDSCEDDSQAIVIDGIACSNFVLPAYWDDTKAYPTEYLFDQRSLMDRTQRLTGPCPSLTPGGYQAILRPGQPWSQVTEMRLGGHPSARSIRHHNSSRRQAMTAATGEHVP